MFSTHSFDSLTIIISVMLSSVLLLGLILSIVVFYTKSIYAEVFSWICSGAWLLFYLFLKRLHEQELNDILDFILFPILLTFFLLLHYRTNLLTGSKLRIIYILKSIFLLLIISRFQTTLMSRLLTYQILDYRVFSQMVAFQAVNAVIVWSIMTFVCINYLQKTNQQTDKKKITGQAILFTFYTSLFTSITGTLIFILTDLGTGSHIALDYIFTRTNLLTQLAYLAAGTAIPGFLAAYFYSGKINQAKPVIK